MPVLTRRTYSKAELETVRKARQAALERAQDKPDPMLDPGYRWEHGIEHDPRSVLLLESIADLDSQLNSDHFCWKWGGDGDNGEILMYLLDIFFYIQDQTQEVSPGNAYDLSSHPPRYPNKGPFNPYDLSRRRKK